MISVADVARELHLPDHEVLGVCRDLGIIASSAGSGLSSTEHRQLRDHFGGDDAELGELPRGSTDRHPGDHDLEYDLSEDLDVDGPPAPPTGAADHHHRSHHHEPEIGTWDTVVAERKAARQHAPATGDSVPLPFHRSVRSRTIVKFSVLLFGVIALGFSLVGLTSRSNDAATDAICVDFVDDSSSTVAADCADAHDAEVVALLTLDDPDGPHPGTADLLARAEAECPDSAGLDDPGRELVGVYLVPTPSSWAAGDRSVVCLLEDPDAPLIGPLDLP